MPLPRPVPAKVSMPSAFVRAMGRLAGPVALLFACGLLAGCTATDGVVPEQDAEGRYVIRLTADDRFDPAEARVPKGATVAWVVDGGRHDVNADDGSFSSA